MSNNTSTVDETILRIQTNMSRINNLMVNLLELQRRDCILGALRISLNKQAELQSKTYK